MSNPMIYDGGKLFPCDATQSYIPDKATVAAVTNLLMEEPDIANAPTEDQEKKEKTVTEGNDMTSADSANAIDPNGEKETEKKLKKIRRTKRKSRKHQKPQKRRKNLKVQKNRRSRKIPQNRENRLN